MAEPGQAPERRFEAALVAVLVLLGLPFVFTTASSHDEFWFMIDARRVLAGEAMYRDFFQLTPPGVAWTAAALFAALGPLIGWPRLVQQLGMALAGFLLYRLARRLGCGRALATLPALAPVVALERFLPYYSHHWMVLPWLAGALLAGSDALSTGSPRRWALAGALAGGAMAFLQTDGLVAFVALAGALVLDAVVGGQGLKATARRGLALAAGLAAPLALVGAVLALQGALGAALYDIWAWPLARYRTAGGVNDVAFATDLAVNLSPFERFVNLPEWYAKAFHFLALFGLMVAGPVAALAWGLGLVARRRSLGPGWTVRERGAALVGLAVVGFALLSTRGRADVIHVGCYAWPAALAAAVVASRLARTPADPALGLVKRLPAGLLAAYVATGALLWSQDVRRAPAAWLRVGFPDAALASAPAVRFLRERAAPGDKLVAFPFGGYFGFYGVPPVGRYNYVLTPAAGYTTREEYAAFWADLLRDRPRFVVFAPVGDPAASRPAYFLTPLPGYRRVAVLPHALDGMAEIYERGAP